MSLFSDSHEGDLELVATLSGRAMETSIADLRQQDELTLALRSAISNGVSVDALSEACGLRPEVIAVRVQRGPVLSS